MIRISPLLHTDNATVLIVCNGRMSGRDFIATTGNSRPVCYTVLQKDKGESCYKACHGAS